MNALTATLKPWQHAWRAWSGTKPIVGNFADPGLGKTVMLLDWLDRINAERTLWVTTASYVRSMITEVQRHSRFKVTDEIDLDQRSFCRRPGTIQLLSYGRIHAMRSTLALLQGRFDVVVADESQYLKRIQAKRTRAAIRCLEGIPRRAIATGSEITNSLMDIWSQYLFLDGGKTFGRSYVDFRQKFFYQAGFEWKPRPWAMKVIREAMGPTAFWCKAEECTDLPPIVRKRIPVQGAPKILQIYKALSEDFLAEIEGGGTISAMFVVAKLMKLAQLLSGQLHLDSGEVRTVHSTKLETAKALINHLLDQTSHIVIWCRFTFEVEALANALSNTKVLVHTVAGAADPTAAIASFQETKGPAVLIATLAKGARAFTFTAADTVIYFNRTPNVEHRVQSIKRTHRIGSERHKAITYYDMYTENTLEEGNLDTLAEKVGIGAAVKDTSFLRKYLAGKTGLEFSDQ